MDHTSDDFRKIKSFLFLLLLFAVQNLTKCLPSLLRFSLCVCLCVWECASQGVCPCVAMRRSLLYLFSQNITLSHCKPLPVLVTAKNPPQCCELGTGLLDTWSHDVGLVDWSLQSCYYNSWDVIQAPPLLSAGACGSSSENYLTPSCLRSGRQVLWLGVEQPTSVGNAPSMLRWANKPCI